MVKAILFTLAFTMAAGVTTGALAADDVPRPVKMGRDDLAGGMFERPGMIRSEEHGNVTLDVTSLKARDGRFASGLYRSGKVRSEIREPYGVDEFMYSGAAALAQVGLAVLQQGAHLDGRAEKGAARSAGRLATDTQ